MQRSYEIINIDIIEVQTYVFLWLDNGVFHKVLIGYTRSCVFDWALNYNILGAGLRLKCSTNQNNFPHAGIQFQIFNFYSLFGKFTQNRIVNSDKVESALIQFLLFFLVEEEEKRQTGGVGGAKPKVSKCQMFLINQKAVSSVIYTQGFSILWVKVAVRYWFNLLLLVDTTMFYKSKLRPK